MAGDVLWAGHFRFAHRSRRGVCRLLNLHYGFEQIIWQEQAYSLVVAKGISDEQLIIWTNEVVVTASEAK